MPPAASSFLSLPTIFFFFVFFSFFDGLNCDVQQKEASFFFDWFGENRTLALYGDAEISGSAVILSSGHIVTRKPVRFFGARPGFSTYFTFSLSPGNGGIGISFFLLPRTTSTAHLGNSKGDEQEMGLLPDIAITVEIIAGKEHNPSNGSGNHVQIRVGNGVLIQSSELSSPIFNSAVRKGGKLHSWIDYDGDLKRMQVKLGKSKDSRLANVSISRSIDLSGILWREAMLVGLSYSSGNSTQSCRVYSWSFDAKHGTPYLMHSEPLDPNSYLVRAHENTRVNPRRSNRWGIIMLIMLFAAACGALVTFFGVFGWLSLIARRQFAPVECTVHPVDVIDEKIILVVNKGLSDDAKK